MMPPTTFDRPASPWPRLARRVLVSAALLAAFSGLIMATFEALYRMQVVDTYAPELSAYNPPGDLETTHGRPTALFMGDSFTAGLESYPTLLRSMLPQARIVNGGISGTGIVQAAIVARERFARFHPKVFVYQIYIGNDLFDITYPVSWGRVPMLRNVYWIVANYLRSVGFVNYRLAQLGYQLGLLGMDVPDPTATDRPFSPALYAPRSVLYLRADPRLIEETALVEGKRARDFATLIERLRPLLERCAPPECTAYVLVIPHCAQVTPEYLQNTRALGAILEDSATLQMIEYPFVARLRSALRDLPNLTVLNPIEALRTSERLGAPVYHSNDDHLNAAGQHVLAGFLAPPVASSLEVPSATKPTD